MPTGGKGVFAMGFEWEYGQCVNKKGVADEIKLGGVLLGGTGQNYCL